MYHHDTPQKKKPYGHADGTEKTPNPPENKINGV